MVWIHHFVLTVWQAKPVQTKDKGLSDRLQRWNRQNCGAWENREWMNPSHMLLVWGPSAPISFSPIGTLQRHLWGEASKRSALQAFPGLPQSPKPAKNLTESFSPAICFKVASQVRDSSCHFLPLPGLTFILHPLLHFPVCVSSVCVIPLYFLPPLFIPSLPSQWVQTEELKSYQARELCQVQSIILN